MLMTTAGYLWLLVKIKDTSHLFQKRRKKNKTILSLVATELSITRFVPITLPDYQNKNIFFYEQTALQNWIVRVKKSERIGRDSSGPVGEEQHHREATRHEKLD